MERTSVMCYFNYLEITELRCNNIIWSAKLNYLGIINKHTELFTKLGFNCFPNDLALKMTFLLANNMNINDIPEGTC